MKHEIAENLIKLSKIFKQGFTVEYKNGEFNQYTNYNKPFIVSYKTIIKVKNTPEFKNTDKLVTYIDTNIPDNCIIGGWFDSDTNTYYIELNKAFILKSMAIAHAIDYKQKAIYDIRTGKITEGLNMIRTVNLNSITWKIKGHTVKLTRDNKYYCTCKNEICTHVMKVYRR